jgi:hypothetical protein
MRVQAAAGYVVERPACLMSGVAFELLGIEPGDRVIVEAADVRRGHRRTKRALRAVTAPDDMVEQRRAAQADSLNARFPACDRILGVEPDLPWIFLDEAVRDELGVRLCSPVRVRPSRLHQVSLESRALALASTFAAIGSLGLFDGATRWILASVFALAALLISWWALRSRLNEARQ